MALPAWPQRKTRRYRPANAHTIETAARSPRADSRHYLAHYHTERPRQGKDNLPLTGDPSPPRQEPVAAKAVEREQRLGGLLNHYRRAA
jgi:hypothetical protein